LIVILVAWTGPRSIGATFGLAVLTFVQRILGVAGEDAPVAGAFHAITALLILGLSLSLTSRAWRGSLLIPPSQLRGDTAATAARSLAAQHKAASAGLPFEEPPAP
jgi:hypothetical protein